jgi:hypothetical protein
MFKNIFDANFVSLPANTQPARRQAGKADKKGLPPKAL